MAKQIQKHILMGLLFLAVGGCRHSLREPATPVQIPDSFSATGSEPMQEKWWHGFKDTELNGLIDQALMNNFDLQVVLQTEFYGNFFK